MYKFGKDNVGLGMRFYKFIAEDEYKIFALVKIDDDDNAQFMDEETFELVNIDKKTLLHEYSMLCNFQTLSFNLYKQDKSNWYANVSIISYKYLRKMVFQQTINYILKLNNIFNPLSSDLDYLWEMYFLYSMDSKPVPLVFRINSTEDYDHIDLDKVVNDEAKLPDSLFMDIEELLLTYILSYDVFEYDDSVNLDNISMKYFFIYSDKKDKYYIVLYMIDTNKVSQKIIEEYEDNIDVIEFMLQ